MKSSTKFQSLRVAALLASAFFFAHPALSNEGGSKVGDGGFAVYCKSTEQFELLDIYEARVSDGIVPEWAPLEKSEEEALQNLRAKVEMVLDEDDSFFSVFENALFLKMNMRQKSVLGYETLDSGIVFLPRGCELRQIAVWSSFSSALEINQEFWVRASYRERGLLLVHEALHRWFSYIRKDKVLGTERIRRIVGLMSQTDGEFARRKAEFLKLIHGQD